jgi:predicted transposase YbfD/YdcC
MSAKTLRRSRKKAKKKACFVDFFADMPDPRLDRKKRHELMDIFVVALCGVLTGAETWTEIEQFGKVKLKWLRQFIRLKNGIPSHDTFGRVFGLIDPEEFGARFLDWIRYVSRKLKGKLVAIDGKTLRRSHDAADGKSAIHMISAWAVENRLVLGQLKTEERSNEITAIPELLRLLDIEDCIVTIDAMGCQKKIAQQITGQGGQYILGLKGNQGKLAEDVEEFFQCAEKDRFAHFRYDYHETVEKDHGRIESRKYWIVDEPSFEAGDEWGGLKSVGMVRSKRELSDRIETETRYYICSCEELSAQDFAAAVRGHWGIENSLHWVLDVAFREDECRTRKGHAAENLARLRHIALNLLREEKTVCKLGIKAKRHRCAIDEKYLQDVLGF